MRSYAMLASVTTTAILGMCAAYVYVSRSTDDFAQCLAGQVGGGNIGGPFTLIDENGQEVSDADVLARPSIVYFGYTFCPDVCSLDAARNAEAVDILKERGYDVVPIFISVDPERDTPEVLREFTDLMHPDMIGLTGSPTQVAAAVEAYKVYARRAADEDDEYYLMDHTAFSYLMLPGHGFADFFVRTKTPEEVATRTECFLANIDF